MVVVYSPKIESGLYRDDIILPTFSENSGWPVNFREKV